ncbi:MAG TPA: hypothetical protein VFS36_15450 [Chitinophagaceae bacterium]|nr:hypothetical protein [Chitinophagaceae bacterium]
MALFSLFSRNDKKNGFGHNLPEIPEETFIENERQEHNQSENNEVHREKTGISLLYEFLDKNYESKGYDDALINPDVTHLEQNVTALKNDLSRYIRKVMTFYEDTIREINFHISSRGRSGMIDTVEELIVKKETAESHIQQVIEIEGQAKDNQGVGHGIIISYTKGFKNGLAAISHHTMQKRNF